MRFMYKGSLLAEDWKSQRDHFSSRSPCRKITEFLVFFLYPIWLFSPFLPCVLCSKSHLKIILHSDFRIRICFLGKKKKNRCQDLPKITHNKMVFWNGIAQLLSVNKDPIIVDEAHTTTETGWQLKLWKVINWNILLFQWKEMYKLAQCINYLKPMN